MPRSSLFYFWIIAFAGLFVLSLDFWNWDRDAEPLAIGLPAWVYLFIGLQLALAGCFYLFSRRFWPPLSPGADPPEKELS